MYDCMYMATTTKKLTILVDAEIHRALLRKVGRGKIGRFLSDAAKPLLATNISLRDAYAEMAADNMREKEARKWVENLLQDSYASPER